MLLESVVLSMERTYGVQLFGCSKEFRVDPLGFFDKMKSFGLNQIEPCIMFGDTESFRKKALDSGNTFAATFPDLLWLVTEVDYFKTELNKRGMTLTSAHIFAEDLSAVFDEILETAKKASIKSYVINTPDYSLNDPDSFAQILTDLSAKLAEIGTELWLHNSGKDFAVKKKYDEKEIPMYLYILKKAKNVYAQIDTGWVLPGDILPEDFIAENMDIIRGIHFKDMDPDFKNKSGLDIFAVLGEGCVNVKKIMEIIPDDMPVVIDQDASKDDFIDDLRRSAEVILA